MLILHAATRQMDRALDVVRGNAGAAVQHQRDVRSPRGSPASRSVDLRLPHLVDACTVSYRHRQRIHACLLHEAARLFRHGESSVSSSVSMFS